MNTTHLKPGQLCTINNTVYRAKKRERGCSGCSLDSWYICPKITDSRAGAPRYACDIDNIILKRIYHR